MTRQNPYQLLLKDLQNEVMQTPSTENTSHVLKLENCLMLLITIFNLPISALADTQSQVTCIFENFYNYSLQDASVLDLPVTN